MKVAKQITARCRCGCNHVKAYMVGNVFKVDVTRCTCDDLQGDEADFFKNSFYHCVMPEKTRFVPYYEYIKSEAWRIRSERAKRRAGYRCQVCNKPYEHELLDTHHRTYERLGYERNDDLVVLCRSCHSLFEKNKRKTIDRN